MKTLQDRVAVVTGAGNGIGRALAVGLAEKGCHVAAVDIDRDALVSLAGEIEARGRRASMHEVDVGDRERLAALPDEVIAAHGHVHVLVNNAGVVIGGALAESPVEDLDWIVGINFWGVVLGCKHFIPHLEREEEGHIVNLSSLFGLIGLPSVGAYCATKAAVRSYSQTLSAELRASNIAVTSVHPGGVATDIMQRARMDEDERADAVAAFERYGIAPERAAARIVRAIERGRPRLRICRETYVSDWLIRLMPVATSTLVARMWTRRQRQAIADQV